MQATYCWGICFPRIPHTDRSATTPRRVAAPTRLRLSQSLQTLRTAYSMIDPGGGGGGDIGGEQRQVQYTAALRREGMKERKESMRKQKVSNNGKDGFWERR